MKPLRLKIQEQTKLSQAPQHVIEKDYALSYILAGIAQQPTLANSLVFKGGTALKKIFFGNYRFSEDLDFSVIDAPRDKLLEQALLQATNISKELLQPHGPFEIQLKRNSERAPHPQGQEAFNILIKFPWQPTPLCRIKVEITHDEPVILTPISKPILHEYGENLDYEISSYHIEEIIAEKLRALLQTHKKLIARGWNKPRARDYYDLWNILKNYRNTIDKTRLIQTLDQKCQHRDVNYQTSKDFFTIQLLEEAHQHWQPTLGMLVRDLPECRHVIRETRSFVNSILQ